MLKKAFDLYCCQLPETSFIHSSYLYINRIISNQLTTSQLELSVLSYLSSQFKNEGYWGLVTVFGLNDSFFSKFLSDWLIKNNVDKNDFIDLDKAKDLLSNAQICSAFEADIHSKKVNARKYIANLVNLNSEQMFVLVDIGWRGTIVKQLSPIYPEFSQCYLLGYIEEKSSVINAFISPDNQNKLYLDLFLEYRDLIEYFFSEGASNIIGIDNQQQPIYLSETNQNENEARHSVQVGILEYFQATSLMPLCSEDIKQYLNRFKEFVSEVPESFLQALELIEADINIQGQSNVSMANIFPAKKNSYESFSGTKHLQSMIYKSLSFFKFLQSKDEVAIYGAGSGADFVLPHIKGKCPFIIDINEKVHGKKINGVSISSLEQLSSFDGLVCVTVLGRKNQIKQLLDSYRLEVVYLEDYL